MTTNNEISLTETLSLYSDTSTRSTGQYFCNSHPFSMPRIGNKVEMLASGKDVFKKIHDAMRLATSFIFIADWQMAHDVELVERGAAGYPGRLHNVIRSIISEKAVHVRVLLYMSPYDKAPGTYDGMVARFLNGLNSKGYPGTVHAILQPATSAQNDNYEYSHHQKFVVIDGKIAFLGGIDLSYGRWETPEFDVVVDPLNFKINEMYSPCQSKLRPPSLAEKRMIEKYKFAEPYGGTLIDEGCQPRMPWQDVHIRVEGPAAVDVYRNFSRRWKSRLSELEALAMPAVQGWRIDRKWLDKIKAWDTLVESQKIKAGGAQVQIVRSVSSRHLKMEGTDPEDLDLYVNSLEKTTWRKCLNAWSGNHQDNILNAMVNCIRSADNYIYIESQFFISQFGYSGEYSSSEVGNENDGIANSIVSELAKRIHQHIQAGTAFHVYLVFPTHPEGQMSDEAYWKQHWLATSTIKHGSASLISRIQRSLKLKKRSVEEWKQYLTVLNMRNYGATVLYSRDPHTFNEEFNREIGRYLVTEQIYIHSKLLIVDDAVAIVGSANINDRSLTGNGDTEIAAVVVDTEGVELRDLGSPGVKVQTRKFARELRKNIWKKHFGFLVESTEENSKYFDSTLRATRSGVNVQVPLPFPPRINMDAGRFESLTRSQWDSIIEKPCSPDTVKNIQSIAKRNADVYEEVFLHTPRNSMHTFSDVADMKYYSLPYPSIYNVEGNLELFQLRADNNRRQTSLAFKGSQEALKNALDAENQRRSAGVTGPVGVLTGSRLKKFGGVVPPALSRRFMTNQLLPHQKKALTEAEYFRRQQLYSDGTVHDVDKAISYLKDNLVGFFVEAPLDWGAGTEVTRDPTKATVGKVDIASADISGSNSENLKNDA